MFEGLVLIIGFGLFIGAMIRDYHRSNRHWASRYGVHNAIERERRR